MAEKKHVQIDTQFTSTIDSVALNSDVRQATAANLNMTAFQSTPDNLQCAPFGLLYYLGTLYAGNPTYFITDLVENVSGDYYAGNLCVNIAAQNLAALKVSKTSAANAVGNAIFCQLSDQTTGLAIATDGSAAKTTGLQAMGTDGTNAQTIATDATGHVKTVDSGNLAQGLTDDYDKAVSAGVAGGSLTDIEITPSQGTNWSVKEVSIYVPGAAADAYFEVARGTAAAHTNIAQGVYYGTYRKIAFDKIATAAATHVVVSVDPGAGATSDVYVTVHYYHD